MNTEVKNFLVNVQITHDQDQDQDETTKPYSVSFKEENTYNV